MLEFTIDNFRLGKYSAKVSIANFSTFEPATFNCYSSKHTVHIGNEYSPHSPMLSLQDMAFRKSIARGDSIQQARRICALYDLFHQRRYVDQRRRIGDRPVLAVERMLIGACSKISRPLTPVLRLTKFRSSFVKRGCS